MTTFKLMMALGLGILVSACSNVPDIASRNAPFEVTPTGVYQQSGTQQVALVAQAAPTLKVAKVNIVVPRSLSVTEANRYYPRADIVWRGDPMGDRYKQVQAIFELAAFNATKDLAGQTDVIIDLQITRFHSLSERTRATVGGVHNMEFLMTVRNAETGALMAPPREIQANLPAFGGNQAVQAERRGQTQKVRVTGYLAQVIRQELELPGSV